MPFKMNFLSIINLKNKKIFHLLIKWLQLIVVFNQCVESWLMNAFYVSDCPYMENKAEYSENN